MIEPLQLLLAALNSEFADKPFIGALATVDPSARPHVRSVVLRHLDPAAALLCITTDRRSAKTTHLQQNPTAELAFWLPSRREQFRIAGVVSLHDDPSHPIVRDLWQQLSPPSRSMFLWPAPGTPRSPAASSQSLPRDPNSIPDTFQVLALHAREVDFLDLNSTPHLRRRWSAHTAWRPEDLNP